MAVDALMVFVALALALLLSGSWSAVTTSGSEVVQLAVMISIGSLVISTYLGLPRIKLNAYETRGIVRTAAFAAALAILGLALNRFVGPRITTETFLNFSLLYRVIGASWRIAARQLQQPSRVPRRLELSDIAEGEIRDDAEAAPPTAICKHTLITPASFEA